MEGRMLPNRGLGVPPQPPPCICGGNPEGRHGSPQPGGSASREPSQEKRAGGATPQLGQATLLVLPTSVRAALFLLALAAVVLDTRIIVASETKSLPC